VIRRRLAFFLSLAGACGIALLVAANCGTVPPTPSPGPAPVADAASGDLFTGQIYDCHAVQLTSRANAVAPVGDCLDGTATASCLVNLTVVFDAATVACVTRDLGAGANAAALAGDTSYRARADAASAWIINHQLGYR